MSRKLKSVIATTATVAMLFAPFSIFAAANNPLHPNFHQLGGSKDKPVTKSDFMKYMESSAWPMLQADNNPLHPQYLSPAEFKQADTNNDRRISREEFMKYEESVWSKIDAEGKGQITELEYDKTSNPLHPQHRSN